MPRPSEKKSVPRRASGTPCSTDRCASSTASAPGSVSQEKNSGRAASSSAPTAGIERFSAISIRSPLRR